MPHETGLDCSVTILKWELQTKEEEEVKLTQQREEETREQTKSAAAKDLLEALQEEKVLDEIEIKQEIVLDPNEWVFSCKFYWIGAETLMSFLLSDSHSQSRAKLQLRDHSSATFVEKFSLENKAFENTFKFMPNFHFMNAAFVENLSNLNLLLTIISTDSIQTSDSSAEFVEEILKYCMC